MTARSLRRAAHAMERPDLTNCNFTSTMPDQLRRGSYGLLCFRLGVKLHQSTPPFALFLASRHLRTLRRGFRTEALLFSHSKHRSGAPGAPFARSNATAPFRLRRARQVDSSFFAVFPTRTAFGHGPHSLSYARGSARPANVADEWPFGGGLLPRQRTLHGATKREGGRRSAPDAPAQMAELRYLAHRADASEPRIQPAEGDGCTRWAPLPRPLPPPRVSTKRSLPGAPRKRAALDARSDFAPRGDTARDAGPPPLSLGPCGLEPRIANPIHPLQHKLGNSNFL